ncbi:methylosome protein WDR77-like [Phlebotomus argentipes]|uniref:methylosome protein WDR77-like n=1 Tax=Phlebotomus argentipes TaxID=94469 RepID=UPI00289297DB|nr:methylosome protein WDR77-like [Phlebotomus argentipes]
MASHVRRVNLAHMYANMEPEPDDAELPTNTQFPQLNTREYNLRMNNPAESTAFQEFHECLDINEAGHVVVAINDYRSRFWVGHFWAYKDLQDFLEREKMPPNMQKPITRAPINVIKLFDDHLVFLGRATGTVEVWSLSSSMQECLVDYRNEHVGSVQEIDFFSKTQAVSVDNEACIKIWDVNYMQARTSNTFRYAHGNAITGVSVRPGSEDTFATVARDKSALLWDLRIMGKPASGLLQNHSEALMAISWILEEEGSFVVKLGDAAGSVLTVDTRKPNEIVQEISAFQQSVKRIRRTKGKYAVCGHTNAFKVFQNNDQLLYEDSSSLDFVRDVAFHGNKVVSLSWDGKIVDKDV